MERLLVTQREELWEIPVHDAWVDPDELLHDAPNRTLTLRFAELPADGELKAERQLVQRRRLSREYRVPFRDWLVVIHNVRRVSANEGWADMGTLLSLDFDPSLCEVLVESNDTIRVAVDRLNVEAGAQGVRWMRRRIYPLGFTSDTPW